MNRRMMVVVSFAAAITAVGSALDGFAAGPGIIRSRTRSSTQAPTRVYRSYSVSPGSDVVPQGTPVVESEAIVDQPMREPAASSRPSRSKPSYMRADSKARGRFGQ
ncbi:MAG: hypothetical protein ACKOB1_08950 [Planctomycetia bacterium]